MREILEQDGHAVSIADSGQTALDLLAMPEQAPDVIFLDYNLGDMDGIQVLQVYHFGVRDPAPVFFLTADTSADTTARLRDTDACGIIGKPVRLAEIREVLADTFPEGTPAAETRVAPGLRAVPILYLDTEVLAEVAAISQRPAFLGEMIEHAVRDIERTTAGLIAALGDAQWDEVRKLAHALKGVAHQMGAFRLKNTAISIMQTDIAALEAMRTKLAMEISDVSANSVAALRDWRNSAKPNASGKSVA